MWRTELECSRHSLELKLCISTSPSPTGTDLMPAAQFCLVSFSCRGSVLSSTCESTRFLFVACHGAGGCHGLDQTGVCHGKDWTRECHGKERTGECRGKERTRVCHGKDQTGECHRRNHGKEQTGGCCEKEGCHRMPISWMMSLPQIPASE